MGCREYRAPRYSPGHCGVHVIDVNGRPDPKHINTSYVEPHKPHDADEHAALHVGDQCVLAEDGESRRDGRALHVRLQLH